MGATSSRTVVFADLTGSTGVFEKLGNERATRAVTSLVDGMARLLETFGGRVVKTLGDGVLAVFADGSSALQGVVQVQRSHAANMARSGHDLMDLQVGLACGEIVDVDGDCYGDAVNVAARLADMSGGGQIWATGTVAAQIQHLPAGVRLLPLGPVTIRGKNELQVVFRVEWQDDTPTEMLTTPAPLFLGAQRQEPRGARIELLWLDVGKIFSSAQMPIQLGRVREADLVVPDKRVSRLHARIGWCNGGFVLEDLSSHGTWVRFQGGQTEQALRRASGVLHDLGEIALGAPFSDFTVPVVSFRLQS